MNLRERNGMPEAEVDNNTDEKTGMNDREPFKERRHAEFFDVVGSSLNISTPEEFCCWTRGNFQHIFPHGMLACGLGTFESQHTQIDRIVTCNFPESYLRDLQQAGGMNSSLVVREWVQTRKPVLFEIEQLKNDNPWIDNLKKHGINNIAAHGQCDINSHATSYFSFFNVPVKLTPRHGQLLEMLVPHLHVALMRALSGIKVRQTEPAITLYGLTKREGEILHWISSGKTNWEIAQVLSISENTVKNHVQRILGKLKVNSRTEAVAKGLQKHKQ